MLGDTGSIEGASVNILWYWVSIGRYWLILCGTGSVWSGTGSYMMVAVGTWWYWVNRRRYWSIHDGTGSVQVGTG